MSTRRRLIVHNPGPYGPYGGPAPRAPPPGVQAAARPGLPISAYTQDAALLNHNLVSAPIGLPPHLARAVQAGAFGGSLQPRHNAVLAARHPRYTPEVGVVPAYEHYAPAARPSSGMSQGYYDEPGDEEWSRDEVGAPLNFRMMGEQLADAGRRRYKQYLGSRTHSDHANYLAGVDQMQRDHSTASAEATLADLEAHSRPFVQAMAHNIDVMSRHSTNMYSEVVGTLVSLAHQDVKLNAIESHTNRVLTEITNKAYSIAQKFGIAGSLYYLSCVKEIAKKAVDMQPVSGDFAYVQQSIKMPDLPVPNGFQFEKQQASLAKVHAYVEGSSQDTAYRAMRQTVIDAHLMSVGMSMVVTATESVGSAMQDSSRALSGQLGGTTNHSGRIHGYGGHN